MKIIHTADLQIGRSYSRFDTEDAISIAEERFKVVEKIAELAKEHQADAILVAGDVFDSQTLKDRSIRRFFHSLEAYPGPWVLLPGNHDAALVESIWSQAQRLDAIPDHVHLALRPDVLLFEKQRFAILAAPLTQRHTFNDLTAWFDDAETPEGFIRVGLAHGSVQGILAEDIDSTNPIAQDRAARARLDYLALGDWHGMKSIDARTWYSGTPEQDRFKDNRAGFVLDVEIDAPGSVPRVQPHQVGHFRWSSWEEHLSFATDLDRLAERLMAVESRDVIDMTINGQLDLSSHQKLVEMIASANARARSFKVDQSRLMVMPTEEDIATLKADGYLGDVLQELRAGQEDDPDGVRSEALKILARIMMERATQGGRA